MIRRALLFLILVAATLPAGAQERVTVATMRLTENGALFLAAARGYFKAEGIDVAMRAYPSPQAAVQALAEGDADFGLTSFTAAAFELAGQGKIKAVAAQVREERGHEGNEIVASDMAYSRGLRKLEDLVTRSVAVTELGSNFHFQLGQIARLHRFDPAFVTLKPLHSFEAIMEAVATNRADAAILPAPYARELLLTGRAHLLGWYSELDAQQLGALFASAKVLHGRRPMVSRFLRAYRRGTADYVAALLRHDSSGKRRSDAISVQAATEIAHYVHPGQSGERPKRAVEGAAYSMDAQARLDFADLARQIDRYKAQGLISKQIDPRNVVDLTFMAGR
jgi:NitT/TauT family transport system substrate-binding protein